MGSEIDHIEKSSNDMTHKFKESGVEEWDSENAKTAPGLSIKERMELFHSHSDNKQFPPDQLEKFTKSSLYARELLKAQNHGFAAVLVLIKLGHFKPFPLPLCEKFITDLASCAKIDIKVAPLSEELHRQACCIVDYLLTQKTTFDEDSCVCYVAMNGILNMEPTVVFLNECITKYPQNEYFLRLRGQLNAFMQHYEDGIRDVNAAIKLDQTKYEYLFDRAGMMRLFYPKVTAEATIDAYKEFLAAAPEDHRMVPESYYGMVAMHLEIEKASGKPNEPLNINLSAINRCFNLGVASERKQLPFFLPYKSDHKKLVKYIIQSTILYGLRDKHKSNAGKRQSHNDKKEQHQVIGVEESIVVGKAPAFRPELSDPDREKVTKSHRNVISTLSAAFPAATTVSMGWSTKPPMVQKSASSLTGLKAITLREMNHREDKVYDGHVLAVAVIDDISFLAYSLSTIIEDSCGDVLLCEIYNLKYVQDTVKARQEFGIGRKMIIINPYMRIGSVHGQPLIRVDDPTSIIFHGFVENMCRYCCKPNARMSCAICKACYCDKECQSLDWKRDHSLICSVFP